MRALAVLLCLGLIWASGLTRAGLREHVAVEAEVDEYQLKAAFLYNFARYTSWPKDKDRDPRGPVVIAILGKDPFGPTLEKFFEGRRVRSREVVLRRYPTLESLGEVHVAVLGEMGAKDRKAAVKKLKAQSSLVVADKGGTESTGASLGFFLSESKIRFEVHSRNLKESKVRLSSQLLKLAKLVGRDR